MFSDEMMGVAGEELHMRSMRDVCCGMSAKLENPKDCASVIYETPHGRRDHSK